MFICWQGEDQEDYENDNAAQKHAKIDPKLRTAKKHMLTKVGWRGDVSVHEPQHIQKAPGMPVLFLS